MLASHLERRGEVPSVLKKLFYPPTLYIYKIEISSKISRKKTNTILTVTVEG